MRKNIIITGFMGSGKSIVAEELARKLGMEFIDMDQIIEERQEMSISDIFAIKGEKCFREQENKLVKELSQDKNMVIATGGGTFLFPDNVRILSRAGEIVCLFADSQTIYKRVKRKKIYNNIKWKIDTTNFTVQEVVDKIINLLRLER